MLFIHILITLLLNSCFSNTPKSSGRGDGTEADDTKVWSIKKSGDLETMQTSRQKLFMHKSKLLNDAIATMQKSSDFLKMKSAVFTYALSSYEKNVLSKHGNEKIDIIRNTEEKNSLDKLMPSIFDLKIEHIKDFMFLQRTDNVGVNEIHVKVDFANASAGGAAFDNGFVQEEQIFALCPDLALYLAGEHNNDQLKDHELKNKNNIFYITRISRKNGENESRPLLFTNIRCPAGFKDKNTITEVGKRPKKNANLNNEQENLKNSPGSLLEENADAPANNILAIAAVNMSNLNRKNHIYLVEDVIDMYSTAYKGFELLKLKFPTNDIVVHTGAWGAGVFGHGINMALALQIWAAHAAGIKKLVFYASDPNLAKDGVKTFLSGSEFDQTHTQREAITNFLKDVNKLDEKNKSNNWKLKM